MRAWLSRRAAAEIAAETQGAFVDETGGMLLGYWADNDVVVTATIGPGRNARRGPTWFKPDHDWQLTQLGDAYAASGRVVTYVGDWHTHPGGVPVPSRRDRRTLRAVRRETAARARHPLMLIVGPSRDSAPVMWCLRSGRRPKRVDVVEFDSA